jgi:hypothetical protein
MNEIEIDALRRDQCPDCKSLAGLDPGPRGGAGQNIFCRSCGSGFNVAWPRHIMFAERIEKRK